MKKEFPQKWAYKLEEGTKEQFQEILQKIGAQNYWDGKSTGYYYMVSNDEPTFCRAVVTEGYTPVTLQELRDHYLPELVSPGYTIKEIKAGKFACKVYNFDEVKKIRQYLGENSEAWNYFNNSNHWPKYINISQGSGHGDVDSPYYYRNGYTILTINDIKFPNEMQEKKILGYKAPFDLFMDAVKKGDVYTVCGNKDFYQPKEFKQHRYYTEQQVLLPKEIVETWEPVYAPEYKVGDYVFAVNCGGNGITGKGEQLVEIVDKSFSGRATGLVDDWDFVVKQEDNYLNVNSTRAKFRKATPKEIKDWNDSILPTIKGYRAEIIDGRAEFGCVKLSADYLKAIRYLLTSSANAKITVQGTDITTEMIDKLLKAIN